MQAVPMKIQSSGNLEQLDNLKAKKESRLGRFERESKRIWSLYIKDSTFRNVIFLFSVHFS